MFDAYIVLYKTMYLYSDKIHIVWFREKIVLYEEQSLIHRKVPSFPIFLEKIPQY